MTGISFELKDKSVDKILMQEGFIDSEIYYSPIRAWFVIWGMFAIMSFPMGIFFCYDILSMLSFQKVLIVLSIYGLITYFIISLLNQSVAITDDCFLVINSHFPFRKLQSFKYENIKRVKISSDWKLNFLVIFGLFSGNFVEIETSTQKRRFYCLFLNVDCYDENWTEKTLDDLERSLTSKGVNVNLEI